jgi:aminopeptidase N
LQKEFSLAMGVRALKNIMLNMLARQGDESAFDLAYQQYQQTGNMSERLGAYVFLFGMMHLKPSGTWMISIIVLKMKLYL